MSIEQGRVQDGGAVAIRRALAFVNPKSGSCSSDDVCKALVETLRGHGIEVEVEEPSQDTAELKKKIEEALAGGPVDMIVAAGGDGTVSSVANAMIGTDIPLGVIPLGTANVLARELNIPVDLAGACQLLVDPHEVRPIDMMVVGEKYYLTQLGVGLDALMIKETTTEQKRRFGRVAYLWTAATRLVGWERKRFEITVDGEKSTFRATQVVVANTGMMGQPPLRWGPDIEPDDGAVDVCIVKAASIRHYIAIFWHVVTSTHEKDRNVRYLKARQSISIVTRKPLPAQADGEIIGKTPISLKVVPRSLRVIVPAPAATPA